MSIQRHFTATGIVIDQAHRVLLIHHNKLGVWLPPGGHVEENERPDRACLREIREETGIEAAFLPHGEDASMGDAYALVLPQPFCMYLEDVGLRGDHFHIDLIYLCHPVNTDQQARHPRETKDMGWFSADALPSPMYHNARQVIRRALAQLTV